jgi:microcystin-dependent protein
MKEFTPKSKIDGFVTIKPGLNLTTKILPGQSTAKYHGLAEKAESLQVGAETVLGGNFLRGDAISATNFQISVLNNTGILYGRNSELAIGVEGSVGVLKHNVAGSAIDVKVRNDGIFKTIARFDSSMRVGIAKDNPDTELDVSGDIQTTVPASDSSKGKILINNTADSNQISNGSLITAGGIGVAKSITIGGDLNLTHSIDSKIISNKVVPINDADALLGTEDSYIGTPSLRYNSIYSKRFYGDLTGTVTGSVTGRAGSANKLAKSSQFIFSGDVQLLNSTELEEGVLNFTGQGEQVEFITELTAPFINSKTKIIDTQVDDELILYRIREDIGLKKVTVKDLLATVPVMPIGTIIPFAGDTAPVGWILCNGQEVQTVDYQELYTLIGYKYKSVDLVKVGFFAVPDLRGRFPLGIHNMGGITPDLAVVNDANAEILGGTGGQGQLTLNEENLPDHKHDLYYNDTQFYATAQKQFEIVDEDVVDYHFYEQQTEFTGVAMKNTQGIKTDQTLNAAVDVLNPFIALNYIIYAG